MSKEQLLEAMLDSHSGPEWDFLQEFYLDKCSEAELAVPRSTFLRQEFSFLDDEVFLFLTGVAAFSETSLQRHALVKTSGSDPHQKTKHPLVQPAGTHHRVEEPTEDPAENM